ncbi:hypothetical protein SHKM778_66970 [Streptomyces sp. KM77-8]|uniref:Uncharacterized protein n=1 Tax=Streptomyces haneummycinicus TaxID=3074435 RepID=A0AAT9HRS4_9ACTN
MWPEPLEPGTAIAYNRERPPTTYDPPLSGVEFVMSACLNSEPRSPIMNRVGESVNVVNVERPTGESQRLDGKTRRQGIRPERI